MTARSSWGRSGPHSVITITEPVKSQRLKSVDEIKRALEMAEVIPFQYLIQHIGVSGEEFDMRKFDAAFSALEELSIFARQRGVEILLENIPNELSSAEKKFVLDNFFLANMNVIHRSEGYRELYRKWQDGESFDEQEYRSAM